MKIIHVYINNNLLVLIKYCELNCYHFVQIINKGLLFCRISMFYNMKKIKNIFRQIFGKIPFRIG